SVSVSENQQVKPKSSRPDRRVAVLAYAKFPSNRPFSSRCARGEKVIWARTSPQPYGVRRQAKRDAALACVCAISISRRSSQSGVALRLPPHSIKSRTVTDSFNTPVLAAFIQKSREGVCSPCPEPVQCFNDCQTCYPMPGCA